MNYLAKLKIIIPALPAILLLALMPSSVFGITVVSPPATTFSVTTLLNVIATFVNYFFTLVMIVAVLAVLYGAFLILTAGGDESRLDAGKKWLLWALVGFAVALLAKGLLTFVCSILGITCPAVF